MTEKRKDAARYGCSGGILRKASLYTSLGPRCRGTPNPGWICYDERMGIECISAITLATHDMGRAVRFYRALGFEMIYGGEGASFTSLHAGTGYLNLLLQPADRTWSWWGRVIFYTSDVDALYDRAVEEGLRPDTEPRDAPWGERFFHITDPDGHEISFAKRLDTAA